MELNEKLARWAGFFSFTKAESNFDFGVAPNGKISSANFTSSLDACFHPEWGLMRKLDQAQYYEVLRSIFLKTDKPALALCKAIEQLIDKETNGS